jgi:hypothetical protein
MLKDFQLFLTYLGVEESQLFLTHLGVDEI